MVSSEKLTLQGVTVLPGDGAPTVANARVVVDPDGCVQEIQPGVGRSRQVLMPPAVDLHLDVLRERRQPRATVQLPLASAIIALDTELAACGVGTVCVGARFEDQPGKGIYLRDATELCRLIDAMAGQLIVDWRVHARVEVCEPGVSEALGFVLSTTKCVAMISMMDHSAESSRFASADDARAFYAKDWGLPLEEVDAIFQRKREGAALGERTRKVVASLARHFNLPLASHDDRTPEQVQAAHALGARISEFPLTPAAATTAHELGMQTVLGAPNAVRGKSTAPGNLLVADAVAGGLCDVLCSDYLPSALLAAPFALAERGTTSLPNAARLVSANPARALGLQPPLIEVGQPMNAVLVDWIDSVPTALTLWRAGRVVYRRRPLAATD